MFEKTGKETTMFEQLEKTDIFLNNWKKPRYV